MEDYKYVKDVIKLPSYLKALGCKQNNIILIYVIPMKKLKIPKNAEITPTKASDSVCEELELTGSPLKIDLGCDEDILGNLSLRAERADLWSKQEEMQFPLPINAATTYLKTYSFRQELNIYKSHEAVYCVCDGHDTQNIVILGTMHTRRLLLRSTVYVRDCWDTDIKDTHIENMKNEHIDLIDIGNHNLPVINCEVTNVFEVYGYPLAEYKPSFVYTFNGSVSLEVISRGATFKVPTEGSNTTVKIQAIVGHEDSKIQRLWEQLLVLRGCVDILEKMRDHVYAEENATLQFTAIHKPKEDIQSSIIDILNADAVRKVRGYEVKLDTLGGVLDNNEALFERDVFSKLFEVLMYCENAGDLLACLYTAMEEIAENNLPIRIPPKNRTRLAETFSHIKRDKYKLIPHLIPCEAVEYLLEIGLYKLTNDYSNIYVYLHYMTAADVSHWTDIAESIASQFNAEKSDSRPDKKSCVPPVRTPVDRVSAYVGLTYPKTYSRSTAAVGSPNSTDTYRGKICLLGRLHVVLDMLHLAEISCDLPTSMFSVLAERLIAEYVKSNSNISTFEALDANRLRSFTTTFQTWNASKLKLMKPSIWRLFMCSCTEKETVETIFHYSISPIFPPNIYDEYRIPEDAIKGEFYYVTKMINLFYHTHPQ